MKKYINVPVDESFHRMVKLSAIEAGMTMTQYVTSKLQAATETVKAENMGLRLPPIIKKPKGSPPVSPITDAAINISPDFKNVFSKPTLPSCKHNANPFFCKKAKMYNGVKQCKEK